MRSYLRLSDYGLWFAGGVVGGTEESARRSTGVRHVSSESETCTGIGDQRRDCSRIHEVPRSSILAGKR